MAAPQVYCYADATELREGTSIPSWACKQFTSITGLEAATATDWIVSGLDTMPGTIRTPLSVPVRKVLERHLALPIVDSPACGAGFLVQRKSGGDLIGSLDKLNVIQSRMMQWARPGACRLLITDVRPTPDGKVRAGDHTFDRSFSSVQQKLWWWEVRGGHVDWLDRDAEIDDYLRNLMSTVSKIMDDPIKYVQNLEPFGTAQPGQLLVETEPDWLMTGSAWPMGWGVKLRAAVHQVLIDNEMEPTMLNAISIVCHGTIKVPGIGKKRIQDMRAWCGWRQ